MTVMAKKYDQEFKERTCKFVIESGKSATSVGEELGIDKNSICSWVREYRRQHKLPSYADSKGINRVNEKERRITNAQIKADKRKLADLAEENEILKKALRIFMQAPK